MGKLVKIAAIGLSLAMSAVQLSAQDKAEENVALIKVLKENSRPLNFSGGAISGAGADFLFHEAQQSQFFLIGEEHGIAENPLFASAVLRGLSRYGYRYFAAEVGQLTATRLEASARQKPVGEVLASFNRQYPFSLPFFNWREEGTLLETAMALPRGKQPTLWGLDYEFYFSPVYHFERLRQLARDAGARAVVDEFYEKTQAEFAQSVKNKNPSSAFVVSATAADFARLDSAFDAKDAEARRILRELRESSEIYRKFSANENYESNLQRAQLMKRNFMSYYNAALKTERAPRVLFKFGAAHVYRGRNYVNVFDLGNMVSELASSNGASSFHVLVVAASGSLNKYLPFVGNEAEKRRKLDPAQMYSYADVRPLVGLAGASSWQIIDLRPLRPLVQNGKLDNLPRGFANLIYSFDSVLLVAEARPTTLFE